MTGMPELGSKISLISKADIRYEGRLYTVDPQECTIALANVRSFGTEDRETSYPIMPQPTVYDYILFRGSDIKDIRVVNNVALPNDPAIMQMHLPPQQNFPQQNLPQFAGGPPQMNQFAPFGPMQGGPMGPSMPQQSQQQQAQSPIQTQHQGNNNSNLAPGSGSGQKNKKSSELSNKKELANEKSATVKSTAIRKQSNKSQDSRSGTPQNLSRKSPTSDMGSQVTNQRENQSGAGKDKPHTIQRNNNQRNNQQQRERRDSGRNEAQENKGYRNQNQNQRPHNQMNNNHHQGQPQQQGQQQRGYNNRNNNNNGNNQQPMRGNQGGSARMRGPPMNNYNRQQNNQGAPIPNQNKPNNGHQQQRVANKTIKFENEFDFESANSKFEELRTQLALLKVGSEETKSTDQVNGEIEKKDDSGNETSADHEAEGDDNGYDKNKSFFDNISCEAVERSKGKTQRTDWRQERKINSETFGYAFNRRGNFRGRGGYYNNQYNRGPRPGGYRGPNPNYRPMRSNHRNPNVEGRSNVSSTNNQASGQQSQNQSAPVAAN